MADEGGGDNVRVAYEYVVKVHNDIIVQQDKNAERANKLILVVWLVFAALSYGATNLVEIAQHPARNMVLYRVSVGCGIVAGIALVVAFLAAMMCARVRSIFVPATKGVRNVVKDPDFSRIEHARIVGALIDNLHEAIEAAFKRQDDREKWLRLSNWVPQAAFVITATFVALTFGQKMLLPPRPQSVPSNVAVSAETRGIGDPMSKEHDEKQETSPSENKTDEIIDEIKQPPREVKGSDVGPSRGVEERDDT